MSGRANNTLQALLISTSDKARDQLESFLRPGGFICRHARNLAQASVAIEHSSPHLIIIEGQIEGTGAASLYHHLPMQPLCPSIMIGDGSETMDRVIALEAGADSYLSHPLNEREVLATARALARRALIRTSAWSGEASAKSAGWTLDLITRQLKGPVGIGAVGLTPYEQMLLAALVKCAGKPLTPESASPDMPFRSHSLSQFRTGIVRLRRKLAAAGFGDNTIYTVRSGGYVFDSELAAAGRIS